MENVNIKKIIRQMSSLMGVTLSFFLSLVGNLASGHFSVAGFLLSFVGSTIVSLIIGFLVPIKIISDKFTEKHGMQRGKCSTRAVEALIADVIYTPIITFGMILLSYKMAVSHGASPAFVPMFLSSLALSMVLGFVLIFIFTPIFLKFVFKKNGISGPPERPEK